MKPGYWKNRLKRDPFYIAAKRESTAAKKEYRILAEEIYSTIKRFYGVSTSQNGQEIRHMVYADSAGRIYHSPQRHGDSKWAKCHTSREFPLLLAYQDSRTVSACKLFFRGELELIPYRQDLFERFLMCRKRVKKAEWVIYSIQFPMGRKRKIRRF